VDIGLAALDYARKHYFDVLLVDTAGRLAIDEVLMREIKDLHKVRSTRSRPCSSSTRCRARTRSTPPRPSSAALPLTGIILTKTDGDSRGGAACRCAR
jgi:signal recognition particle subunit SRP54